MEALAAGVAVLFAVVVGHALTRAAMHGALKLLMVLILAGLTFVVGGQLGAASVEQKNLTVILLAPLGMITWSVLGVVFLIGGLLVGWMLAVKIPSKRASIAEPEQNE